MGVKANHVIEAQFEGGTEASRIRDENEKVKALGMRTAGQSFPAVSRCGVIVFVQRGATVA